MISVIIYKEEREKTPMLIKRCSIKRNKANIPWYVIANLMEIKDNEEILKRAREGRRHITFNNKTFSLSNTSSFPMQTIYKIMDYTRSVNNFTYNFRGPGNTDDIKEKIDNYLN